MVHWLGLTAPKVDYVLHFLGARETADRRYTELSPEVRAVAEGYAAGLNHYAEKASARSAPVEAVSGNRYRTLSQALSCAHRFFTG